MFRCSLGVPEAEMVCRGGRGLRWSCREEEGVKEDMKRAGETEEDSGIAKGEELKFYNRML